MLLAGLLVYKDILEPIAMRGFNKAFFEGWFDGRKTAAEQVKSK